MDGGTNSRMTAYGSILNSLFFGIQSVSVGFALSFPCHTMDNIEGEMSLTSTEVSLFGSLVPFGAVIGCLLCMTVFKNIFGWYAPEILCAIEVIAWMVLHVSDEKRKSYFLIHRFLLGFSVGGYCAHVPFLLAEQSRVSGSSWCLLVHEIGVTIGSFLVQVVAFYVTWREVGIFCIAFPVIFTFLAVMMPVGSVRVTLPSHQKKVNSEGWSRYIPLIVLAIYQNACGGYASLVNGSTIGAPSGMMVVISAAAPFIGVFCRAIALRLKIPRCLVSLVGMLGTAITITWMLWVALKRKSDRIKSNAMTTFLTFFWFGVSPFPENLFEEYDPVATTVYLCTSFFSSGVSIYLYRPFEMPFGEWRNLKIYVGFAYVGLICVLVKLYKEWRTNK